MKGYKGKRRVVSGKVKINLERQDQHLLKQFKKYLQDDGNKTNMIKILFQDWSTNCCYVDVLSVHTLNVNLGNNFFLVLVCHKLKYD